MDHIWGYIKLTSYITMRKVYACFAVKHGLGYLQRTGDSKLVNLQFQQYMI